MAKSYFVCNIIGTGQELDDFRPAIADLNLNWSGIAATDHDTNLNRNWMLVVASGTAAELNDAATAPGVIRLPFGPADLDKPWTSVGTSSLRSQISSVVRSRTNIEIPADDPRTLREVLTFVGRTLNDRFNPNSLDVFDENARRR